MIGEYIGILWLASVCLVYIKEVEAYSGVVGLLMCIALSVRMYQYNELKQN